MAARWVEDTATARWVEADESPRGGYGDRTLGEDRVAVTARWVEDTVAVTARVEMPGGGDRSWVEDTVTARWVEDAGRRLGDTATAGVNHRCWEDDDPPAG
jgi:hypothetical protein